MEDNENLQVLDVQMKSGKDAYISILVGHFSRMAFIIASEKMQPDQLFLMANLIINMIPGIETRQELLQKMKNKMAEIKAEKIKEGYSENVAKSISISTASVFAVGECTDFLSAFLGIIKNSRIEIDLSDKEEEFLEIIEKQKKEILKLEEEIKTLKFGEKNVIPNKT